MSDSKVSQVLIVGGGAAGIYVAALLRKRKPDWQITIVEPSETHYYQPGFTIVGGGVYSMEKTMRSTVSLIPKGVNWIKASATQFEPQVNTVHLDTDKKLSYEYLVVCPGLVNDIERIEGLSAALGKNGVTSNYVTGMATYTWQLIDQWHGGKALFTQPPVPFKCPGAPQKIAYLAADRWLKRGLAQKTEEHFFTAGAAMFGIPEFAKALDKVVARYGITPHFMHNLVAVDGKRKAATFERTVGDKKDRVQYEYDLLHVTPPEVTPEFLRKSELVNPAGFVDVDQGSLQHTKFPNIYSLGDASSTPNSKTAAAVRKQAPILVSNLLAHASGLKASAVYDGYGSCPLTTSLNTVMLAEFIYGGKITPTFKMNPFEEKRIWWQAKLYGFPALYWQMLKGLEFDVQHSADKARKFLST